MNGSSHVTCKDGLYNGSAPNCLPKGKVDQSLIFFCNYFHSQHALKIVTLTLIVFCSRHNQSITSIIDIV